MVAGLGDHPGLTEGLPPGVAREEDVAEPVVPMALTVEVADQVYLKVKMTWPSVLKVCLGENKKDVQEKHTELLELSHNNTN